MVQRVARARVVVGGETVSEIGRGLLVLLGVAREDGEEQARRLAAKVAALRVFEDTEGKMNLDCRSVAGEVLCVSQFTLLGDVRRENRPSFDTAAPSPEAEPLWRIFCEEIRRGGLTCREGEFGAEMRVELVNDGPGNVGPRHRHVERAAARLTAALANLQRSMPHQRPETTTACG